MRCFAAGMVPLRFTAALKLEVIDCSLLLHTNVAPEEYLNRVPFRNWYGCAAGSYLSQSATAATHQFVLRKPRTKMGSQGGQVGRV